MRRLAHRVAILVCKNGHIVAETNQADDMYVFDCPHCGRETWEDGNYCVVCGRNLKHTPEPQQEKQA